MSHIDKSHEISTSEQASWTLTPSRKSSVKLIRCFAKMFTQLPSPTRRFVADVIGKVGYWLCRKDRLRTLKNVRTFYPNTRASMQRSIVVRSFQHVVRSLFDLMPLTTERATRRPDLKIRHLERLDAALSKQRGVILITGHYGNPEVLAIGLKGKSKYFGVLYKPTRFGWLIDQFRHYRHEVLLPDSGFKPLESSAQGLRNACQLLSRGYVVVMAADLTWSSGFIPVSFLQRAFRMSRIPASISLRTSALLLPVITVRDHDGGYEIIFEQPIEPPQTVSRLAAERTMTEAFARILERYVDSAPEQWCWLQLADQTEQVEIQNRY